MPYSSKNTLGRFLAATACLAHADSDDSTPIIMTSHLEEEDDGASSCDDDEEEPRLTNISMESEVSETTTPENNVCLVVEKGVVSSVVLDEDEEVVHYAVHDDSPEPLDLSKASHVCIPLHQNDAAGCCHLDLLQVRGTVKSSLMGTVSNGALGLLRYILLVYGSSDCWGNVTILQVGAGPGLVGLGVAAVSKGKAPVAVTESPQIMPLLDVNMERNQALWTSLETDSVNPQSRVLEWGKPIPREWLRQFLKGKSFLSTRRQEKRRVIITGADVIDRRSLLEPLLSTISELFVRVREFSTSSQNDTEVECILACQSTSTNLNEFCEIARKNSFSVERIAIVELNNDEDAKLQISQATVQFMDTQHRQLPPVTQTKRGEGIVWIVRIRKVPYTFTI